MVLSNRKPGDTSVVYHYCSAETLIKIVENKTIRFSDVNLLNDGEEGQWGYNVFIEVANLFKDDKVAPSIPKVPIAFIDEIDKIFSLRGVRLLSVVASFSNDGDSLSQWRAYADDGHGFAIGFKVSELLQLPATVSDVIYKRDEQINRMTANIAAIYKVCAGNPRHKEFFKSAATLALDSISLKNPAWRDEKEVRCHHVVDINIGDKAWKLRDHGGTSYGHKVAGQPFRFQARRQGVVTGYVDIPFRVLPKHQPIDEIVFGPRNGNGFGNIKFLLGNNGYENVKIREAGSAYR